MNAERLHAIVDVLKKEITETRYPRHLKGLVKGLEGLAEKPADPKSQRQVDAEIQSLRRILSNSVADDFSPIWRREIEAMEIADLVGNALLAQIEAVLDANDDAPDAAAAQMAQIQGVVERFIGAVNGAASSLHFFRIGDEHLNPGDFEVGFMIPRKRVNNGLKSLGEEFVALQQLLGPFSELAGENRPEVNVRAISSSEFQVFLIAGPTIAASVAYALDRLASVYERILHIRLMEKELAKSDIPDTVLDPLSSHIEDLIAVEIEAITEALVDRSTLTDEGRLNELRTELRMELAELAQRIEQGYNVEVRTGELPEGGKDQDDSLEPSARKAAESVLEAQAGIRSLNAAEEPGLSLKQPDDLEGTEEQRAKE
ncbi:MAG TPA: hypothetical protein VMS60_02965 [Solirubrobacterales bacterium]|nr:hypothetical protein [Solirubrobacterales bacterium]